MDPIPLPELRRRTNDARGDPNELRACRLHGGGDLRQDRQRTHTTVMGGIVISVVAVIPSLQPASVIQSNRLPLEIPVTPLLLASWHIAEPSFQSETASFVPNGEIYQMGLETIEKLESNIRGYVRAFPTVFDTASGARLVDTDGRSYIDFFAGAGTLNYGHNNPRVKQSLISYLERNGVMHGLDTATRAKTEFLQVFDEVILTPRQLDYKIQFTGPTGTNAVEAAIKLAKKKTQRSHVVAFTNAYHGHSLGSLALTGNQYYHDISYGSHNNVTHLPYDGYLPGFDSAELLDKMLNDGSSGLPLPAAVIVETIQGEGGINVASFPWLRKIQAICRRHNILFIVDDIQVGNGRTGTFFSFEPAGLKPDIVCLSKAIGGGLPMSLVLIAREHDIWKPGQHTGTFRGNNLAFVAATSLMDYWRDDSFSNGIKVRSNVVSNQLNVWKNEFASHSIQVRGRGLVWGVEIPTPDLANAICREAFRNGLIIETSGASDQVVKLLPPLNIDLVDLESGLQILDLAFRTVLGTATCSVPPTVPSHWESTSTAVFTSH